MGGWKREVVDRFDGVSTLRMISGKKTRYISLFNILFSDDVDVVELRAALKPDRKTDVFWSLCCCVNRFRTT